MRRPLTLAINDKRDLAKVPTKYSGLIGQRQIGQTLIILDGDKEDVLTSKEIEKIITKTKFKDGLKYTWLVPNVTIEAEKVITDREQDLLRLNNFYWTDETFSQREEKMNQFIAERKQQLFNERQKTED
jgi:hypothetical protein